MRGWAMGSLTATPVTSAAGIVELDCASCVFRAT